MRRIALLAVALWLTASTSVFAMGGGGVGAGGAGFGLPLWQPPGAAYGYYGSPADQSGYALRHPVRRPHHHSRYRPQ